MIRGAPVLAVGIQGTAHTLDVENAELTLDETWAPYAQLDLACPTPSAAVLEALDPRTDVRLDVTIEDGLDVRVLNLGVRTRVVDYLEGSTRVLAASDEAMLQDRGHTGTTPDEQYRGYESNLRALINASALKALPGSPTLQPDAGATADLTVYTDSENLITNPSAEVDTAGWTASNCTLARLVATAPPGGGSAVFRISPPTSASSFMFTATAIPVTPGQKYVYSGVWMLNGSTAGTPSAQARCLVVIGNGANIAQSAPAVNSGDRVTVTFTVPEGVTSVTLRAYNGYPTTADVRWDALKFAVVSGAHDSAYFDGATPDTAVYRYDWTGTAHASTSSRTNITGTSRAVDMFTVYPGMTWWDYVEPLVQAAGLRLYCDELKRWHLVNPETWLTPGGVLLKAGVNLEGAQDGIDRYADTWASAVVVRYAWTDGNSVPQVRWDVAGSGSKVFTIERATPYPGPGAAGAILSRMTRRGHLVDLTASVDILAAASQPASVELPDGQELTSAVTALTMRFPDGDMDVVLRDPIEAPPSAWLELDPGESWLESPIGESWLEEVI